MKKYEEPELKVTKLAVEDVITLSAGGNAGEGGDVPGEQPGIIG